MLLVENLIKLVFYLSNIFNFLKMFTCSLKRTIKMEEKIYY